MFWSKFFNLLQMIWCKVLKCCIFILQRWNHPANKSKLFDRSDYFDFQYQRTIFAIRRMNVWFRKGAKIKNHLCFQFPKKYLECFAHLRIPPVFQHIGNPWRHKSDIIYLWTSIYKVVSSVRSSSGYHGLLHIRSATNFFKFFKFFRF